MEPSNHCPYLGLKQNRAIRFALPTPEHRCYVTGDAIDIPVEQSNYCLSQDHVHCPLYTGSMLPTTLPVGEPLPPIAPSRGVGGWLGTLSPRDRAIYSLMVVLLGLIVAGYLFLGVQSLFNKPTAQQRPSSVAPTAALVVIATPAPTAAVANELATPSPLPTSQPTPEPTLEPTTGNLIIIPTNVPPVAPAAPTSQLATTQPVATNVPASATVVPASATVVPASATSVPTRAPTAAATVQATSPTALPSRAPTVTAATVTAATAPAISTSDESLTLYFGDPSGALYVPVTRQVRVENGQTAAAAVRELIAGPQRGLTPLLLRGTKLLGVQIADGTAIVNFDRSPTAPADLRGYYSVVYTLTQLPSIQQVQFQINGQNFGIDGSGPVTRPVLNPINPESLPEDTSVAEFLPLYFPLSNGMHDVRLIRVVPKTKDTARATLNALLEGPNGYGSAVQRVIPEGTQLRGVTLDADSRVLTVDFTKTFTSAKNRQAAVRNIVQSLTTLPNIRGVQILVENQPLADFWGEDYRNGFGKPQINPE